MRASRTILAAAGAVVAGFSLFPEDAAAGTRAPGPRAPFISALHGPNVFQGQRHFRGDGAARGPFFVFNRQFDRPLLESARRERRGRRNDFGLFDTGGFGDSSGGEAAETAPQFVSIYAPSAIYGAPIEAPFFTPGPSQGPEIIDIGRRAPRRVARPVVVYGDPSP